MRCDSHHYACALCRRKKTCEVFLSTRDVIFVIPVRHTFQSYSHSFVGTNNTSTFGLAFPNTAAGFSAAIYWCFTRHCCWHRNFQLSTSVSHGVFEFFIPWINEMNTTQSSGIVELWFLDSPLLFALLFAASDICFHISGHTLSGLEVVCYLVSLHPDHEHPSRGLSFKKKESCEACPCIR